jgi:hypothetical protein
VHKLKQSVEFALPALLPIYGTVCRLRIVCGSLCVFTYYSYACLSVDTALSSQANSSFATGCFTVALDQAPIQFCSDRDVFQHLVRTYCTEREGVVSATCIPFGLPGLLRCNCSRMHSDTRALQRATQPAALGMVTDFPPKAWLLTGIALLVVGSILIVVGFFESRCRTQTKKLDNIESKWSFYEMQKSRMSRLAGEHKHDLCRVPCLCSCPRCSKKKVAAKDTTAP